ASYFDQADCDLNNPGPPATSIARMRATEQRAVEYYIREARQAMASSGGLSIPEELLNRGWAGAGIWYNRIAEINGAFFSAVNHLPVPSKLPLPMEQVMTA